MTDDRTGTLQGFELAKEGAERAVAHADAVEPQWRDLARGFVAGFILQQHGTFTSEDVWQAAEKAGIPKPPDRRAWGGILRGFRSGPDAKIKSIGTAHSKIPELHGNWISVYQVL